ncbi:MAG: shikimate kinase [Oscillospiraceae bacterium]|nr:shikimate kinase [Oscillospiraceae bacterium]
MQCGLLGKKLGHSYSPQIHRFLGDYPYTLHEKQPEELEDFLRHGPFTGLNVTIPYKKTVIPFCDLLSETAKKMGAVNTIVRQKDGTLVGHNTDYFGFSSMVERSGLRVNAKKVLVLGSGGASNTAVVVLRELGAQVVVISRSADDNYNNLHRHSDATVIVNATPVGMYPENGISPVDLSLFPKLEGVLDMIYNPARTQLLMDAETRGLIAMNGLWMLVAQAKESAEWFTGKRIDDKVIQTIHDTLRRQMENIVLIGMPGAGKSTVAAMLAQELGRRAVDADAQIVKIAGCSIPEIFARGGETEFRTLETQILRELGKQSGLVIATGGGCVTREENYALLHQNSRIFWLTRELSKLPTDGRPLSQGNRLGDLYETRRPMYERFADYTVSNDAAPEETLDAIRRIL